MMELADIKVKLKNWERKFVKEHGRRPGKDDIDNNAEIKDVYKAYNQMKKEGLESAQPVGVWGAELNKNAKGPEKSTDAEPTKRPSQMSSSARIGQKLWEQACATPKDVKQKVFKKAQMGRSVIVQSDEDVSNGGKRQDTPRPTGPIKRKLLDLHPLLPFNSVIEGDNSTSTPGVQPEGASMLVSPKEGSIFAKALKLTQNKSRLSSSENIAPEQIAEPAPNPSLKKSSSSFSRRTVDQALLSKLDSEDDSFLSDHQKELSNQVQKDTQTKRSRRLTAGGSTAFAKPDPPICGVPEKKPNDPEILPEPDHPATAASVNSVQSPRPVITTQGVVAPYIGLDLDTPLETSSKRQSLLRMGDVRKEDTPVGESDDPGRGQKRKLSDEQTGSHDVDETDEKKRKAEDEMETSKKKTKSRKFGPSGLSTVSKSAGTASSTNYVRLNMKTKSYRHKGAGRTGPQLKRLQWKQKMTARSQSRGTKCFKCGEEGHWAKNCKGKKMSSSGPTEDDPDLPPPGDFPTLGEALRMAQGVAPQSSQQKKDKSNVTDKDNNGDHAIVDATDDDGNDADLAEAELAQQGSGESSSNVPPAPAKPLYQLTPDGDLPLTPSAVLDGLKTFGYDSFRPSQERAIMRILCGQSTLLQLATGAGKSLCYQLPALLYAQHSPAITLIISPLVSLMEDQVTGLPPGLNGVCLHTNMTKPQREKVVAMLEAGEAHFLLLSPEALVGSGRGLLNFSRLPPIAFACIDEAHCVSSWSHHFRPSYLRVCKVLREKMGIQCLLGLTATATKTTACNVASHLGITDGNRAVICGTAIPDNLVLSVSRDDARDSALIELLKGDRFASCHSIIIYCTRRDTTERLATMIRTNLKDEERKSVIKKANKSKSKKVIPLAEAYHAGLTPAARKRVQTNFMCGALQIVVATVAFGMGLDKQDVRGIIHYNLPSNFESYVQEIGRAGRDGKTSHCHVFLNEMANDLMELKRHIYSNTVDRVTVKKLVNRVFSRCRCEHLGETLQALNPEEMVPAHDNGCRGHQRAVPIENLIKELDMREEGISTLLCYLELHPSRWLEAFPPVYATCTIHCYGGPHQLNALARKCPAVAVAVAKAKLQRRDIDKREFSFPVFEVADSLGTDPVIVKSELSRLKWLITPTGYQRSNVVVEFSELAFRVCCRGNLSDEETDSIVTMLTDRITMQETSQLHQLHNFHNVLHKVSHKNFYMCADTADMDRCQRLRDQIRLYFGHQPPEGSGDAPPEMPEPGIPTCPIRESQDYNEAMVCGDIRQFIQQYCEDHSLTARSITRIFHGIASPNFPADVWGRVRRFWRCHLDVEFNTLLHITKRTLLSLR